MNPTDSFDAWTERLRARLAEPLPGLEAQGFMAPVPRSNQIPRGSQGRVREAAVVAVLHPAADPVGGRGWDPRLLLTLRTAHLGRHQGQVCLPGGALDPGETPRQAARREVQEELGLPAGRLDFLGALSPLYVPVSGFEVHPFVARVGSLPPLRPDPNEVAKLLDLRLADLIDPSGRGERLERRGPTEYRIPFFRAGDHEIWGATAMMLSELCAVLPDFED